jgi:hypothetical protein
MRHTPVERIDPTITTERHGPPDEDGTSFDERTRLSIRWQLGF